MLANWREPAKRIYQQPSSLPQALTKWLFHPERSSLTRIGGSLGAHPNFLIIGAQKGGSTSLYRYLTDHPKVRSAALKEIHYFSCHYDCPETWYRAHFAPSLWLSTEHLQTGEASVSYLYTPTAPGRVAAFKPDMKLVVMLRNPISRAYSHHQMSVKQGHETLSFEEALTLEPERLQQERDLYGPDEAFAQGKSHRTHSYLLRGHYAEQLERWLAHFPREQLLILSSEDFFRSPAETFHTTLAFLGLKQIDLPVYRQLNKGQKAHSGFSAELMMKLEAYFAPHNARLEQLLGRPYWTKPLETPKASKNAIKRPDTVDLRPATTAEYRAHH